MLKICFHLNRLQTMKKIFKPAKQDKLSTLIIKQIRSAILQAKYQPGDSLPTESELVEQFGVSKHTVREALRALEGMGFMTVRRGAGGGPIVSKINWETARESFADFLHFQDISIHELSEIRLLLEPFMARKAAENLSPEMAGELKEIHAECEDLVRQDKSLVGAEAEVMFHVLLAKYSGNSALWVILDFVNNVLMETKRAVHPGQEFSCHVLKAHEKILTAILNKDGAAAEKSMRDHILEVEDELTVLVRELKQPTQREHATAVRGGTASKRVQP
jgi:GntR family transcriptional repressor for pyruvate dehydrogenase complex